MAMLRTLVPFSVFFLIWLLAANGRIRWPRLARGFKRLQYNMLKRADPIRMLETSSSLTSMYVGGTGIWWRSGLIFWPQYPKWGKESKKRLWKP